MTRSEPREPEIDLAALDPSVHHPARLGLLTVLCAVQEARFGYLKSTLGLTDGNLSRNLSLLEEAGLVVIRKGYEGRRPRTWVAATPAGRQALDRHLAALRSLAAWRPATDAELATAEGDPEASSEP